MIQHIVLWKIKNEFQGVPKNELIQEFKNKLERLPELISDIDHLQVCVNYEGEGEQVCDLCLISMHADQETLQRYADILNIKVLSFAKNIGRTQSGWRTFLNSIVMVDQSTQKYPIDGILDLHSFKPNEINGLIPEYITECLNRNILEIRIIHGKR